MAKHEFSCETANCYVCTELFMTGQIYYGQRLTARYPAYTHVSDAIYLCGSCNRRHKLGFLALIEIDVSKSDIPADRDKVKEVGVVRTGKRIHIRRADAARVYGMPELLDDERCVAYVDIGKIDELLDLPNCRFTDDPGDEDDAEY